MAIDWLSLANILGGFLYTGSIMYNVWTHLDFKAVQKTTFQAIFSRRFLIMAAMFLLQLSFSALRDGIVEFVCINFH